MTRRVRIQHCMAGRTGRVLFSRETGCPAGERILDPESNARGQMTGEDVR